MTAVSALDGGFKSPPQDAAHAFRNLMEAMARPGTLRHVSGATPPEGLSVAAGVLLLTLTDPETPVHLAGPCDTPAIRDWLTFHTGAPQSGAAAAVFAVGPWDALMPVDRFAIGTAEYPDRSATLVVEMTELRKKGPRLTGPGIQTETRLMLPDVSALQANAAQFPLGFDCYFCSGDRLAGLPRTTLIEEGV